MHFGVSLFRAHREGCVKRVGTDGKVNSIELLSAPRLHGIHTYGIKRLNLCVEFGVVFKHAALGKSDFSTLLYFGLSMSYENEVNELLTVKAHALANRHYAIVE